MLKWITDFFEYVDKHPKEYNRNVKNNVRQTKALLKERWITYKKSDPIAFEEFAMLFRHQEGELAGQPFIMDMEQKYIIACILGIKIYDRKRQRWLRFFTELNLFVSRKWGKDTFIAPLACWFLGMDKEPSAWGQIVAENSQQSKRTFEIIEQCIKQDTLAKRFKKIGSGDKKRIICNINSGKLEFLSGRAVGKDGPNPSFGIANEVHEVTKIGQYTSLKTGQGARAQPMMLVISSAGNTPDSIYEKLEDRDCKLLEKSKLTKNDKIFALIFGIDVDDAYKDESTWVKACPGMKYDRPTMDYLRQQYNAMKNDPIQLNVFIAKHLNRQIGASVGYYDQTVIKRAATKLRLEDFFDTYATGGVDLAETTDLCNATACILKGDKFCYLQVYFIAEECLARNSKVDKMEYGKLQQCEAADDVLRRLIIITPGSYVQKEYVTRWFCLLRDTYKISFLKIGYDRALSKEWLTDMQESGFNHEKVDKNIQDHTEIRDDGILTSVIQGGWTLSEPIKIIRSLFENGKIAYDESNILLRYCFWNLRIKIDSNNNMSPHKSKSTGHIDGCMGIFNSFVAYQRAKQLDAYRLAIPEIFKI